MSADVIAHAATALEATQVGIQFFSKEWCEFFIMVVLCLSTAFLAAGLTMGLISLEPEKIRNMLNVDESYARSDEDRQKMKEQKVYGERLLPLITNHHRLLVTLLLTNALANEALPVFLKRLVPTWLAVFLAVALVLVFGEVIPSAVFTGPSQLAISARFAPLVGCLQNTLHIIVQPIASLLDVLLGSDHHHGRYHQGELVAMLQSTEFQGAVEEDTKKMLLGAVDTERKLVSDEDILTPMNHVFMLPLAGKLDVDTMADIIHSGFSRVPVYDAHKHNIRGILIIKRLIYHSPSNERPISTMHLKQPVVFRSDMTLRDALNVFQQGASHLALVVSDREKVLNAWQSGKPIPPDVHMAGIVTLEKILENILREHIEDEEDRRKAQLLGGALRSIRDETSTFNLDDEASEQKLLSLCFDRWKMEWKLTRTGTGPRLLHRSNSVPEIREVALLKAQDPELGEPLLARHDTMSSTRTRESSSSSVLQSKASAW